MKAHIFGDVAVVTGTDIEKSAYKGKDISGQYIWMDVFAHRQGRWQAVASQWGLMDKKCALSSALFRRVQVPLALE